jgi:hypothetical protein
MEKETKKYLIIGGVLILTVSVGVVIWKKYQVSSDSSAAATDQANQDALSLEAASLASNAYAGSGAASYSPQLAGASTPTSLADEVLALERALGFNPSPTPPATSTPPSGSASVPTSGSAPTPPTAPAQTGDGSVHPIVHPAISEIKYHHGAPDFEPEGVMHEGVLVS